MGKMIFWLVVFFVVLLGLRLINIANARKRDGAARRKPPPAIEGTMARCVSCGVYLPSADAIRSPRGPLCGDPKCRERRDDAR